MRGWWGGRQKSCAMMKLWVLVTMLAVAAGQSPCASSSCKFTLCNVGNGLPAASPRRLTLRPGFRIPNGPLICRTGIDDEVGRVIRTGEPVVLFRNGQEIQLSRWRPSGLTVPFARRFFFTQETSPVDPYIRSGVAKRDNRGNQQTFLRNLCVQLPIRLYEEVDEDRNLVRRVRGRGADDCVAFSTRTMDILVELNWIGPDDLDLSVDEPGGETLSRFNLVTRAGRFGVDASERCFSGTLTGKETGFYRTGNNPDPGTYTVRVVHAENCGTGVPTKWNVRVSIKGVLLDERSGESNLDNGDEIIAFDFDFS